MANLTAEPPDLTPQPPRCGAMTRSGRPCRKGRGWKTPTPGWGRCALHAGATPSHQVAVHRQQARAAIAALDIPTVVGADPTRVLQEVVDSSAAMHRAIDRYVREMAEGQYVDPRALAAAIETHGQTIDRAARVAEAALRANLAGRVALIDREAVAEFVGLVKRALVRSGIPADAVRDVERSIAVTVREYYAEAPINVTTPALPTQED